MCVPVIPREIHLDGLRKLVQIDKQWTPSTPMSALNVRHAVIATDPCLGVRPSESYIFCIITGPVGAFFSGGFSPVRILVEEEYTRAAPGGVGAAKTGGNYAASLRAQAAANAAGYDQVLWLDGSNARYVEEAGAMNIFFKFQNELVTPPLRGTILPGITRDSILVIARDMGLTVNERLIGIDEVIEKIGSADLEEVFCAGTAAIVAPVAYLGYKGKDYQISDGKPCELAEVLLKKLTDIQYGVAEDPYGWREIVA